MRTQSGTPFSMSPPRTWQVPEQHMSAATDCPWYVLIGRLQSAIVEASAAFYRDRRIRPVLMPVTVGSVSSPIGLGSDSLPVCIDLMGSSTYLADSMQFQLELLLRHGFEGVYYIMPSFRGEEPDATHLNQFFHSEAEIRGGLAEVMQLVEDYVRSIGEAALMECRDEVLGAAGSLQHVETLLKRERFPRVRFCDAVRQLGNGALYVQWGPGQIRSLTRLGEQELIRRYGGVVWVTHFDALAVPFYQSIDPATGEAQAADLLFGCGEVVGCGERHRTRSAIESSLEAHGVDPAEYEWYLRMKENSPMTTSGFGLGVERFLLWLLRHEDARDLQIFPRVKGVRSWI